MTNDGYDIMYGLQSDGDKSPVVKSIFLERSPTPAYFDSGNPSSFPPDDEYDEKKDAALRLNNRLSHRGLRDKLVTADIKNSEGRWQPLYRNGKWVFE